MAMYSRSNNSNSDFREKMSEILDHMYPHTIPANRRKGMSINPRVYEHIEEERKRKQEDLKKQQQIEANKSLQKLAKGVHMTKQQAEQKSSKKK